jgi:glycosyltransferase involved in cell wall biosynthesis
MEKNFLIIEAYTDANIGSGALVENIIKILNQHLGVNKENIRIMAHYPTCFETKYNVTAVHDVFKYPFGKNRLLQIVWLVKTTRWMLLDWIFYKYAIKKQRWKDYDWADIVISIGAERINDKNIKNEFFSLYNYAIVKRFGKVMILAPSTFGPFLYKHTKILTKKVFGKLDLIYCRDQKSFDTISSFNEICKQKIINTNDIAILQDWDLEFNHKLFDNDRPVVGISVLQWNYSTNKYSTPFCNYESYKNEMALFVNNIIEKYHVNIIFFPTNFPVNGCGENDLLPSQDIIQLIRNKSSVKLIENLISANEFKSMLACSELNITTRMHACILSTGAFIPTMSINYLFKLREYMSSLNLGEYALDIEDFNPNIVHLNNIHSYLSPIIASIARKRNIRVIWTLHDYKLLCPRYDCLKNNIPCEKCFKNKKFVILNRCMKNSFMGSLVAFAEALYWNRAKLEKNTDHFICPSEFMKFKMLKGGFNPKKLSSVYNFIEEEKTINDHFEKENYVSYLGRLSSEKGLYTLLKAIYDLKIHIKIIGSGPIEEELKNVFKNENIEFLGYQSWSSIKEIIQLAKFVILPSEWYENNPLSVIESLCLGTPVLCSRIGGMPELINIGINGNLFESGDVDDLKKKIVETYQMQFDYRKIAEISKLKFSSVKYYKQIMEIYK